MSYTLWFTGLSGSGKSTVAEKFKQMYPQFVLLDGDVVRKGLCSDLGFSKEDRSENMRRLIALCALFNSNDKCVITAFISPYEKWRMKAKETIRNCYIVYCNSDLNTCEKRDVKGLYKKARAGEIPEFTGISSPYEIPENADLVLDTQNKTVEECMTDLFCFTEELRKKHLKKTICVDFDGVITDYDGYKGWGNLHEPVFGVAETLAKLREDGWKIIVHTTRNETRLIEDYMNNHKIPFDEINRNSDGYMHANQGKPYADIYLDDRSLTFNGNWSKTYEQIKRFKTWKGR